jgi:hypothetical protein
VEVFEPASTRVGIPPKSKSKSKLCYDRRWFGQSLLVLSNHLGLTTRFSLLSDSCGFVNVEHSLFERTGLLFTIAAGTSQHSHSLARIPRDSWLYFTVSDLRLPQPGGPGPRIYIPQEQGGPVIPTETGFPFRRLLRLAGLRWRYSKPPSRGVLFNVRVMLRLTVQSTSPFWNGIRPSYSLSLYRFGTDLEKTSVTCQNAWHEPHRKHRFLCCCEGIFSAQLLSNRSPITAYTCVAGVRLPSRCLEMCIHITILSSYFATRIMEWVE